MTNIYTTSLLICIFSILILISIILSLNKKIKQITTKKKKVESARKEELKSYFEEEWNNKQQELLLKQKGFESELGRQKTQLDGELKQLQAVLNEKEKRYNEINKDLDLYRDGKIKEIDGAAAEYEQRKQLLIDQSIEKYRNQIINQANESMEVMVDEINGTKTELEEIKKYLEEERSKRAAINEEIRRQRAVEEQQDFYRIQLNPNDKNDIELLRSITPRLQHPEAINKVIWTGYYQKPLAELRKRVAVESSGIYKITRIKTGEIYIGKAVNVSTRWSDHCKTALGVGTLATSQLHRVMAKDGCENFTFELLEETPKEKLSERESFYIDFYDSKTYGLNSIKGEQKSATAKEN